MPTSPNISVTLPNDGDSGWGDVLNTAINGIVTGVNLISIPTTGADVGATSAVAPTTSNSFAAVPNYHYPIDASSGAITIGLPTGALQGSRISAEREDSTTNVITFSGNIRGVAGATVTMTSGQFESMNFVADASGSWWPYASHKTRTFLDATYAHTGVITGGSVGSATQVPVITYNSSGQITGVTTATVSGGGGASDATTSTTGLVKLAGDLGGSGTTAAAPVLKSVGTAGTYGSASLVPIITTDAQGRVSGVTTAAPSDSTRLSKASNLSDLASASTAVTNLGLGNVNNTSDANKPVSTAQAANDALFAFHVTPRLGYVAVPPGFISSANAAMSSGILIWYPFYVGGSSWTTDAFYTNVTTAQSGGTTSYQVALYKDDGTGWPDGTQQVIAPTSVTLTATGNIASTISTPYVLSPGRYWVFCLYQVTSAPTTSAVVACLSNTVWSLPVNTGTLIGSVHRGYQLGSQTSFPSAAITTTGVTPITTTISPVVGMRRSA